jgi:hypothetical protein
MNNKLQWPENVHPEYNLVAVWNMCAEKEYDGIDVWFN